MRTVLTIGTFDLFHVGHLELLSICRGIATSRGRVVVGVNTDAFVERFKGRRPVIPVGQRMEMLAACRHVDEVVVNTGEDARPLIEAVAPRFIAIGDDWAPPRDYLGQLGVSQDWLDERGIEIVYLVRGRYVSTTQIRDRA